MADKPSEEKSQGRQGRALNAGNVTNLNGVINKHRQQPNTHQNSQNCIANNLLLDLFERINQIVRTSDDPDRLAAQFLEICREVFACDQVWLLSSEHNSWSIKLHNCRPQTPLSKVQTKPFRKDLSDFFQRTAASGRPLALTAATQGPIPVAISREFGCHSLLLMPLPPNHEEPALLLLNQSNQLRIWHHDDVRLLQELTRRLSDGLNQLSETQSCILNESRLHDLQQHTLNVIPLALIGIDNRKRVCQWNRQAEKLFGIKTESALGRSWETLFKYPKLTEEQISQALAIQAIVPLGQINWQQAEQSKRLDFSLYPCADTLAATALIRVDDATERMQMEELAIQQEKMVSIGNLASGVAHEINNPLAGVLQNLQVLRNRLHPNLPKNISIAEDCGIDIDLLDDYLKERGIHTVLNTAIESGQQAAKIVHNMLNLSHKDNVSFQYHQLSVLLDKAVELAAGSHNLANNFDFRNIEIARNYATDLPELYCSSGQLQQVFLSLLTNGAHALSKRLRFWEKHAATLPRSEKPRLTLRLQKQDTRLICEIEDNGCGMNEEVRKRVFEPFYTTKQPGTGTGLGMSICYFIVTQNHNGCLSVDSIPDAGSRFILELPLSNRS